MKHLYCPTGSNTNLAAFSHLLIAEPPTDVLASVSLTFSQDDTAKARADLRILLVGHLASLTQANVQLMKIAALVNVTLGEPWAINSPDQEPPRPPTPFDVLDQELLSQWDAQPIESLNLGTRMNTLLHRGGIRRCGTLRRAPIDHLWEIQRFGDKSVAAVEAVLAEKGLTIPSSWWDSYPPRTDPGEVPFRDWEYIPIVGLPFGYEEVMALHSIGVIMVDELLRIELDTASKRLRLQRHLPLIQETLQRWGLSLPPGTITLPE